MKAMTPAVKEHLGMVDALDMLQCPRCGTYYVPRMTETGRTLTHCRLPADQVAMTVQWYDGEVEIDFAAIEARVIAYMQAAQPLTGKLPRPGSLVDVEV